ncbi:glycosyltransferase [Echinicola vietnamensis]|uniref:Glycosyl transferase n=1 Tax=Echinicola vietnamensis (strain DSM 17526 / LMG 23754 / KMM 6221) TaxID=926556 RepID=L0G702_ECHVK|nr:glycosyltransferase [Echinicola vietnamensis]AGA80791.1 glycosyl transferase [Echinicola vietnamensis DSM 17526]
MFFSIIIPVYNRPSEVSELLQSLCQQTVKTFEVVMVEDGSTDRCEEVVRKFEDRLAVRYFYQQNSGQGFARNFGMKHAKGDYFVFFDSDCVIPDAYLMNLQEAIQYRQLDAHGGPDQAAAGFSPFQKAINFSMTSFWTTGGIRGKVADPKKYQARGYNMGFSRKVYDTLGGFVDPNRGEDIELSIRIKKGGFHLELVKEAYVYHKRRNDFMSFLRQSFSFGQNRVNVNRFHPGAIKAVHLMPALFLGGFLAVLFSYFISPPLYTAGVLLYGGWTMGVLLSAAIGSRSLWVGVLSVFTSYGQLFAYGAGLVTALLKK